MIKLMVPVDGSECSKRAVEFLVRKSQWFKDGVEIHLLTVHPPIPAGGRLGGMISHDKLNQYYHDEGIETLKSARAVLDAAKVAYTFHISVGDPAQVITQFARDKGCDQIVMGTRGLGEVTGAVLGSVATKVVHLATVPVLLVK